MVPTLLRSGSASLVTSFCLNRGILEDYEIDGGLASVAEELGASLGEAFS